LKVRIQNQYLIFTKYTDAEIKWMKDKCTWFERGGTMKAVAVGDSVQIKQSNHRKRGKIARVIALNKGKVQVVCADASVHEFMPYHLTRMDKDEIIRTTKSGVMYTLVGLLKLFVENAPFKIEVENPTPTNYQHVRVGNDILPGITLYDFQVAGVNKSLTLKRGLNIVPTGGGKSEMILAVLRYLISQGSIKRGIVVVPSVALSDQLVDRGRQRGFDVDELGSIHGTRKDYNSVVVVAVLNSLVSALRTRDAIVMDIIQESNALLYDECHHLRSDSAIMLANKCNHVEYLLGYSGSPFLLTQPFENAGDTLIWGITGGPIYTVTHDYLRKIGLIAEPVVFMKQTSGKMLKFGGRFQKIYDSFIMKDKHRNEAIAKYAHRFVKNGFQVLILVQRLEHADTLMKMLDGMNVISVFGGKTGVTKTRDGAVDEVPIDYDRVREEFSRFEWDVMIGSSVLDEGVDLPSVGAVILAGGGKSRIKNLQRIGRGLRRKKVGANRVYILDFMDRGHVFLASHSKKRLELYQEVGATIVEDEIQFNNMVLLHGRELKEESNG
jgi:superfamily II DNA or RNA helicase